MSAHKKKKLGSIKKINSPLAKYPLCNSVLAKDNSFVSLGFPLIFVSFSPRFKGHFNVLSRSISNLMRNENHYVCYVYFYMFLSQFCL